MGIFPDSSRSRTSREQQSLPKAEERETHEQALDFLAETLLLAAKRVDEGQNGVILELDVRDLDPEFAEFCTEQGIDLSHSGAAVKVLKVYQNGSGLHEFNMQQRAYKAVLDDETAARVPRPIFHRDLSLSENARKKLLGSMSKREVGQRAEIIVMDFVRGIDFAEMLYREALYRGRPDIPREDVNEMTIEVLQKEVAQLVGFKVPGGKGKSQVEKIMEQMAVEEENAETLYRYLSEHGFQIDPTIIERVNKSLRNLHTRGIAHRDLHERNLMIDGDPKKDGEGNEVFLIDFGSTVQFEGAYGPNRFEEIYADGDRRYFQDEKVVRRLGVLTNPPETRTERIFREDGEMIVNSVQKARKHRGFSLKREQWLARHDGDSKETRVVNPKVAQVLYKHFIKKDSDILNGRKGVELLDYYLAFIEQGRVSGEDLATELESLSSTQHSAAVQARVRAIARGLVFIEKELREKEDASER